MIWIENREPVYLEDRKGMSTNAQLGVHLIEGDSREQLISLDQSLLI
jgi:hypothetical protein